MKARDRIKLFCIARGISQRKLGKIARMIKQEVSHVGSGRYTDGAAVKRLAKAMGVRQSWLVYGRGPTPVWARPMIVDARLPTSVVNLDTLRRLMDDVADLRARVAWLTAQAKGQAGVDTKRKRART